MQANKNAQKTGPGTQAANGSTKGGFWMAAFWIALVMAVLFYKSFYSGWAHFANDGPLGAIKADYMKCGPNFFGSWLDIYWLGMNGGFLAVDLNSLIQWIAGPVGDAKFLQPLSLFFLGICAWVFFRQLRLSPLLSIVAALGAALNMNFFSNVCWGLGTRGLTLGWVFLALALIVNLSRQNGENGGWTKWIKVALGGLLVGMSIIEGADNGAIFSLYVGLFVIFLALIEDGLSAKVLGKGITRAVLIALFAGFIAAQTIISLVGTQVKGIAGMQESTNTVTASLSERIAKRFAKDEHWDWATQWSLPKAETWRVIIPGLYGYRMDSPDGKQYWGRVGETPGFEKTQQGISRFSGSGEYAGVLVLLIALWALAESFRRDQSALTPKECKIIWFWSIAAFISLLLAWGRYAPFYQFFYALPYFSTIRNPIKFMHPFHLSVMILFGYGLLGLSRRYLQQATSRQGTIADNYKDWWAKGAGFEKRWAYASIAAIGVSFFAYVSYFSTKATIEKKVVAEFGDEIGKATAAYSVNEVLIFVFLLTLSVALLTLIFSGAFAGKRATWGGFLLGLLLFADMAHANNPWIKFYNYEEKYASNPVVDYLRNKPYENRVVIPPFSGSSREFAYLQQLYMVEWLQHHFPYYNIQSLDVSQEPRMPADKLAYRMALNAKLLRYWQLTNTRYIIGTADMVPQINAQLDPQKNRFKLIMPFKLALKDNPKDLNHITIEDITATTSASARLLAPNDCALIEFTGALPRAKLYSNWQTTTNDETILRDLPSDNFDPEQTVLISGESPASSSITNAKPGTVEFVSYAPKDIKLRTQSDAASVLLLNDRYDPGWKVWIDGKPDTLLRANFIMRGANVPAGQHTVEFRFQPEGNGLYFTLAAVGFGLLLCGVLLIAPKSHDPQPTPTTSAPQTK
jgi:hypothetical protein